MPTTKTAGREMRLSVKRQSHNKAIRSSTKTVITKAEKSVAGGDLEAAKAAVTGAIRTIDSEAAKGIAHRNKAARRKSRLMKKLNAKSAPAKTETKKA